MSARLCCWMQRKGGLLRRFYGATSYHGGVVGCGELRGRCLSFPSFFYLLLLKLMECASHSTHWQFFRKRIPCSCLDEKYKEVRSITKMGFCCNLHCQLPNKMTVRSKMVYCVRCRKANYCSRECQVAAWPNHKEYCGKSAAEMTNLYSNS